VNGALYVLKIEKRNNELEGKDTAEGRRYVVLSQPAQELRRLSLELPQQKRAAVPPPPRGEAEKGGAVKSKMDLAQVNEVLLKVLCHNIYVVIRKTFEWRIEPDFFGS
jgi:hypothetical protein